MLERVACMFNLMTFVQHFLLEECFDFDQTFSNNVICVSNIVRSVLITMLGRVLLTMLQRVARALAFKY